MRESYRLQKHQLKSKLEKTHKNLAVFFVYTGNIIPQFTEVYQKIRGALERLGNSDIF